METLRYSVSEVIDIAQKIAGQTNPKSRSLTIDENSVVAVCARNSRSNNNDTLLYAVNFGDNSGFTVINAFKEGSPVLGITENGDYDSEETSQNENFQLFMNYAMQYAASTGTMAADWTVRPIEPVPMFKIDSIAIHEQTYRVKVRWNQYWPENMYCPNKVAGCGPIAVAQLLSYFEYPTSMALTYDGRDQNQQILNWTELKKHVNSLNIKNPSESTISSHVASCNSSLDNHKALARFVREVGVHVNADYRNPSSTSAYRDYLFNATKQLLSTKQYTHHSTPTDLFDTMREEGVVGLMFGQSSTGGHFWVVDGYAYVHLTLIHKVLNRETNKYEETSREVERDDKYIHHNWGWGGNSNGYFLEGVFDTTKGTSDHIWLGPWTVSRSDYNRLLSYISFK